MIDMSPGAVDRRLRRAARLAEALLDQQRDRGAAGKARREHVVDMSPEAVDRRLREVSELRALCLSLRRAG